MFGALGPYKFRILLASQLVLLLGYPYIEENPTEVGVLSLMSSVVLLTGLYSVSLNQRTLYIGGALAVPALIGDWWSALPDGSVAPPLLIAWEGIFFLYVTVLMFREVMGTKRVTTDTLAGAVSLYLLFALAWGSFYVFIESISPGAFKLLHSSELTSEILWSDLLYFSFTALTTVGYGDITPISSPARSLASLESVVGVLYLAIIIGKLIGLHLNESEHQP